MNAFIPREVPVASIHLPCGCHINDAFVLGMCIKHYHEYREKVAEDEDEYRVFEQKMTRSVSAGEPAND